MANEKDVKNRIKALLKVRKVTENKLSRLGKFSQKVLNNQFSHNASLQVETVLFLLEQFPDVSVNWLMKGEGEMFVVPDDDITSRQMSPLPEYNSMVNAIIVSKDETIATLKEKIKAKDETIAALNGQLAAKNALIEEMERKEVEYPSTFGVAEPSPRKYKQK